MTSPEQPEPNPDEPVDFIRQALARRREQHEAMARRLFGESDPTDPPTAA